MTRILRPLRFITKNSNIKLVVEALVQSIGGIMNVLIVLMIVWLKIKN